MNRRTAIIFLFLFSGTLNAQDQHSLDSMLTIYRSDTLNAPAVLLDNIGAQYYQAYTYNGYNTALIYFQKGLDKARKTNDLHFTAVAQKLIAGVYDAINMNLDTAALYYQKGLEYDLGSKDSLMIIQSYRNMLVIYDKLKKPEKRSYYSDKLYGYLEHYNGPEHALYRNQLSIYYSQNRQTAKAAELFTPVDVKQAAADNIESFRNYYYAGHFLYQAQERYREAIALLNGALPYTRLTVDSISIYKFLSEHYYTLGDYKNAFICLNQNSILSSAYVRDENSNKIAETVSLYTNVQKEQERLALKEKSATETRLKNYALIVLFLLVLVVLIIAFFALQTRKRNRLLKAQKEEVDRLNKLNRKIFSVISHDFNAPLVSMNLLLNILKSRNYQPEELDEYADDISNQISQSKLILENLLSWARAELNMQQLPGKEPGSNVHTVVNEVIGQFRNTAEDKHLTIVNAIPDNVRVNVLTDILKIIFRNLLSNAIKFSHSGQTVTFGMNPDKTFFIKDEGVGIDPVRMEQLFYEAVGNKLGTSNETGFGLGLYMTYELVSRSGGKIMVKSKPGKGSIFILALPTDEV